jgi:hypothetical protein
VAGGAREEPSVGREVATDTATDVGTDLASDLVGGGVLGRAAGSYVRKSQRRSRRAGSSGVTLRLEAGTGVRVFLQQAAIAKTTH